MKEHSSLRGRCKISQELSSKCSKAGTKTHYEGEAGVLIETDAMGNRR